MPIYDFVCDCGNKLSPFRSMDKCSDPVMCHCGRRMRRVYSNIHINLKGAGKSPMAILGREKMPEVRTNFEEALGAQDLPKDQWKWKKQA